VQAAPDRYAPVISDATLSRCHSSPTHLDAKVALNNVYDEDPLPYPRNQGLIHGRYSPLYYKSQINSGEKSSVANGDLFSLNTIAAELR
jgi:hypothetical protein